MQQGKDKEENYEINRKITFSPCLQSNANILSRIFFVWTHKLMQKGAQKPLEMNDLFELREAEEPEYAYTQFCRGYEARQNNGTSTKDKTIGAFWDLLGTTWVMAGILAIIANGLQFAGPLMIKQILKFITGQSNEPMYMGYVWASILVGSYLIRTLVLQHSFHFINLAAVKCMNSSTSKIYFKVLKLSSASRKYLQTGAIMNHINVDTQAFQFFLQMSSFLFSTPFMVVISIALTIVQVGWIGLCAPVIFFIGLTFQNRLMKKAFALRKDQLIWTDKRSKCVNEYFSGIRIVKYYGWEQIVSDKIEAIRKQELKINFKNLLIRSYVQILINMLPIIASIIVFSVFVGVNGAENLQTYTVYTTISLFNMMSNPMRLLVMTLVQMASAKASLARVDHFYQYPERKNDGITQNDSSLQPGQIKIDGAQFRWETHETKLHNEQGKKLTTNPHKKEKKGDKKKDKKEKPKSDKDSIITSDSSLKQSLIDKSDSEKLAPPVDVISLRVDNLHIKQGQFIGVVGQVGSGKSTLLNAILNEVDKVKGNVRRNGRLAYIPQISWLRSATIRENILFQSPYNEEKYKDVLKRCELQSDLKVLAGGDLTQVGERGVNLSGGQKQRISIARALYADADIYLIDDCLSALDSYVAKKIYNNVIKGALALKTVVFVTHAIQYVHECDEILVMSNKEIFERGTFAELSSNPDSLYNTLQVQYKKKVQKDEQDQEEKRHHEEQLKKKQSSVIFEKAQDKDKQNQKIKALVKVEQRTKGSVPWSVYYRFFTGAGGALTVTTFIFIFLGQMARVASDWWLGCWSSDTFHLSTTTYIEIYTGASILVGVLIFFKGYLFARFIIATAQAIQRQLISVLLHTPLSWFDVTPTGRIISRTTKDQDDLDSSLSFNIQVTVQNLLVVFCSMLIIGIATPIYLAIAAVSLLVYYFLVRYYMLTAVELKRLEANSRSPLISHIQQTINGMYVIRAFGMSDNFIRKFFQKQKEYIVAYTNQNVANRWISLITDCFSVVSIAACSYLAVTQRVDPNDPVKHKTNLLGLAITWSLQISAVLSFTLKMMADTESNMNAVIRLLDYIDHNPREKDFDEPLPPSEDWPTSGKYAIKDITYRYRPDLDDVIHGISFDVESKSKIGVVGRTGSGKSTLTLGLLRILELSKNADETIGHINLDNVDIANIGLHCLRHRVTIIPQDPVLFTGTVKSNIDPFNKYSEQEVAQCLKQVEMWDQIRLESDEQGELHQKVYSKVDDSGSNFSVGQRQLICLARALIRKPRVLLMDQATASIDEKTDALIQKMIRRQFNNTTVITIAHRLNTIINYDKILVLDYGRVKEYGKPVDLVTDESTFLGKLLKDTGRDFQKKMIYLAQHGAELDGPIEEEKIEEPKQLEKAQQPVENGEQNAPENFPEDPPVKPEQPKEAQPKEPSPQAPQPSPQQPAPDAPAPKQSDE